MNTEIKKLSRNRKRRIERRMKMDGPMKSLLKKNYNLKKEKL